MSGYFRTLFLFLKILNFIGTCPQNFPPTSFLLIFSLFVRRAKVTTTDQAYHHSLLENRRRCYLSLFLLFKLCQLLDELCIVHRIPQWLQLYIHVLQRLQLTLVRYLFYIRSFIYRWCVSRRQVSRVAEQFYVQFRIKLQSAVKRGVLRLRTVNRFKVYLIWFYNQISHFWFISFGYFS